MIFLQNRFIWIYNVFAHHKAHLLIFLKWTPNQPKKKWKRRRRRRRNKIPPHFHWCLMEHYLLNYTYGYTVNPKLLFLFLFLFFNALRRYLACDVDKNQSWTKSFSFVNWEHIDNSKTSHGLLSSPTSPLGYIKHFSISLYF